MESYVLPFQTYSTCHESIWVGSPMGLQFKEHRAGWCTQSRFLCHCSKACLGELKQHITVFHCIYSNCLILRPHNINETFLTQRTFIKLHNTPTFQAFSTGNWKICSQQDIHFIKESINTQKDWKHFYFLKPCSILKAVPVPYARSEMSTNYNTKGKSALLSQSVTLMAKGFNTLAQK